MYPSPTYMKSSESKCLFKHGNKIIVRIEISDLYTNGILDLGQFFQRLEKEAGILKIKQLKVAPSKKIFESVSIDYFKTMGNKVLKYLRVALLQPMIQIR